MRKSEAASRWLSPVPDPAETRDTDLRERQQTGRDAILTAAADVFIHRGYRATSMDDVAEQLGCTKGRIYHYFRTKGELFLGVHRRTLDMSHAAVRPLFESDLPADQKLEAMALAHARLMLHQRGDMRLAVRHGEMWLAAEGRMPSTVLSEILQMRRDFAGYYVQVIEAGVAAGLFRGADPELIAMACLGAINWMSVWVRETAEGGYTDMEPEEIARQFATFVTSAVMARPKRRATLRQTAQS